MRQSIEHLQKIRSVDLHSREHSMRTWAQGTARAVVLTASFVALGAGTVFPTSAFADTNGDHSVLGGNQLDLPISAPIDASGNAVGVAGKAAASSKGGSAVRG